MELPSLACVPHQNPHTYGGPPVGVADEELPSVSLAPPDPVDVEPTVEEGAPKRMVFLSANGTVVKTVTVYDLARDCNTDPLIVTLGDPAVTELVLSTPVPIHQSDADFDYGTGGGFFPGTHHDATVTVTDDAFGTNMQFIVGSDGDGSGAIGDDPLDCMSSFAVTGTTTCPAGADGGRWVAVLGVMEFGAGGGTMAYPTTGRILTGNDGTVGSAFFKLAGVAAVTIHWTSPMGDEAEITPDAGWDCVEEINDPISWRLVRIRCEPVIGAPLACQGYSVVGAIEPDFTTWPVSSIRATMDCSGLQVQCVAAADGSPGTGPFSNPCTAIRPDFRVPPFWCIADTNNVDFNTVDWFTVECFNDP